MTVTVCTCTRTYPNNAIGGASDNNIVLVPIEHLKKLKNSTLYTITCTSSCIHIHTTHTHTHTHTHTDECTYSNVYITYVHVHTSDTAQQRRPKLPVMRMVWDASNTPLTVHRHIWLFVHDTMFPCVCARARVCVCVRVFVNTNVCACVRAHPCAYIYNV